MKHLMLGMEKSLTWELSHALPNGRRLQESRPPLGTSDLETETTQRSQGQTRSSKKLFIHVSRKLESVDLPRRMAHPWLTTCSLLVL